MKQRNGFVSNSSSSSFVVIFDAVPRNAEDLRQAMFGDKKNVSAYDHTISTLEAARSAFNQIRKQKKPLNPRKAALMLDMDGVLDFGEEAYDKNWEARLRKAVRKAKKDLIEKSKGKAIFVFNYGDENGTFGCVMEHGEIFKNFEHFRISHH